MPFLLKLSFYQFNYYWHFIINKYIIKKTNMKIKHGGQRNLNRIKYVYNIFSDWRLGRVNEKKVRKAHRKKRGESIKRWVGIHDYPEWIPKRNSIHEEILPWRMHPLCIFLWYIKQHKKLLSLSWMCWWDMDCNKSTALGTNQDYPQKISIGWEKN